MFGPAGGEPPLLRFFCSSTTHIPSLRQHLILFRLKESAAGEGERLTRFLLARLPALVDQNPFTSSSSSAPSTSSSAWRCSPRAAAACRISALSRSSSSGGSVNGGASCTGYFWSCERSHASSASVCGRASAVSFRSDVSTAAAVGGLSVGSAALAGGASCSVLAGSRAVDDGSFGATPGARLREPLGASATSVLEDAGAKDATNAALGRALAVAAAAVRRGAKRSAADQPGLSGTAAFKARKEGDLW